MESISRISSLLETARDLTLEAARDAGPRRSTKPLPAAQIKKLLDSRHEREVLDGLRRVTAMQYANPPQPTLTFFPAVLKTLSNPYPSTRPLVYNYLLHHAESDPDTALLAINTIQKSLSDSNPRIRAMALKTMSGIRVPVISQIVSLAIKKGTNDLSPIVRKVAALACVKCVKLDPNTRPQVEEYLATLLADKQYYVAGAAVQAFVEVCPERLDLIHPVYRRLCKMVVDMDEWGQLALMRLMTVYARKNFPRKTQRVKREKTKEQKDKDFYEDLEPEEQDDNNADFDEKEYLDPDLELFLKSIQPLLSSRNSAVIVAIARAYHSLAPSTYLSHAIDPLVALLRSPLDIQQAALYNIVQICLTRPDFFSRHFRHFLIRSTEGPQIWRLKLEVLTLIFADCPTNTQDLILAELEHFSSVHDVALVRESVRAIGRCASRSSSSTSRRCLTLLLKQIHSPDQNLAGEAMEVIRHLIQRAPEEHTRTVIRLAKNLDTLHSPTARASIIWLVGEFAANNNPDEGIAADVLRILIRGYTDETDEVRAQIILLAAKVYLAHLNSKNANPPPATETNTEVSPDTTQEQEHPISILYHHTMLLARYTPSYDVRDRARLYKSLLSLPTSTDLASLLLLAPKPVPNSISPSESRRDFLLGSASLIIGSDDIGGTQGIRGYEPLPEWVEEGHEPDPRLREVVDDGGRGEYVPASKIVQSAGQRLDEALEKDDGYRPGVNGGGKKKEQTLDDWLDEESEEETDEEDEDETEEESEEEESEEETESEEEETESEDERRGLVR